MVGPGAGPSVGVPGKGHQTVRGVHDADLARVVVAVARQVAHGHDRGGNGLTQSVRQRFGGRGHAADREHAERPAEREAAGSRVQCVVGVIAAGRPPARRAGGNAGGGAGTWDRVAQPEWFDCRHFKVPDLHYVDHSGHSKSPRRLGMLVAVAGAPVRRGHKVTVMSFYVQTVVHVP